MALSDRTRKIFCATAAVLVAVMWVILQINDDEPSIRIDGKLRETQHALEARTAPQSVQDLAVQYLDSNTIANNHPFEYLNFTEHDVTDETFALCGRIRLYQDQGLILTARREDSTIYISNIQQDISCNASSISIYVDVSGPERLGGFAIPNDNRCEWHYPFMVTVSGTYTVEARLLSVDGHLDANQSLCNTQSGVILYNEQSHNHTVNGINLEFGNGTYLDEYHVIDRGSMKHSHRECCEWCTRRENCGYWMSTGFVWDSQNGCILLSKNTRIIGVHNEEELKEDEFPMSLVNIPNSAWYIHWVFGESRNEETTKYLGRACGDKWGYMGPCTYMPDLRRNCEGPGGEYGPYVFGSYGEHDNLNLIHSLENKAILTATDQYIDPLEKCVFSEDIDLSGRWRNVNHNGGSQRGGGRRVEIYPISLPLGVEPKYIEST